MKELKQLIELLRRDIDKLRLDNNSIKLQLDRIEKCQNESLKKE